MLLYLLMLIMLIMLIILAMIKPMSSTKITQCSKIYYSIVQKTMIRNERPKNKILIDNMLKKMSIKSGVSPAIIKNCAKQKK